MTEPARDPKRSASDQLVEWANENGYKVEQMIEHTALPNCVVMLRDRDGRMVYWTTALTMETACSIALNSVTKHPWALQVCKPPKLRLGDIADPKERAKCEGDSVGAASPRKRLENEERVVECDPLPGASCAPLFGEQRL